jgi:hypothetical protein
MDGWQRQVQMQKKQQLNFENGEKCTQGSDAKQTNT